MIRRYTDLRAWLRSLAKNGVHSGLGAVLAGAGSNSVEGMMPAGTTAAALVRGIGLDFRQMVAVFLSAAFLAALRQIQKDTAPTNPPFASPNQ